MPGPPPKRQDERVRRNRVDYTVFKLGPGDDQAELPFPVDLSPQPVDVDAYTGDQVDPVNWHPIVRELWNRLQTDPSMLWTGGAAMAIDFMMCEQLHRLLSQRVIGIIQATEDAEGYVAKDIIPLTGAEVNSFMAWAKKRGLFEEDRLRLHREITFKPDKCLADAQERDLAPVLQIVSDRAALFEAKATDETG